ncbi:MAG: hypothetical protein ABSC23_03600 [Bryobacteraceae bacterium]
MKRGWFKRLLDWMRGGAERPSHVYSMAGWVRRADGVYLSPDEKHRIYRRGKVWYRETRQYDGEWVTAVESVVPYPTLRAAIKQERTPEPPLLNGFCYCLQPTEQKDGFCVQCGKAFSPTAVETKGERC